jgi:hypothetical protein
MIDSGVIDLYHGRYQDVLADVECDTLVTDPPYGACTHDSNARMHKLGRSNITYACWTPEDVGQFVTFWSERTRGWMACMCSDDLITAYRDAYAAVGRKTFAPVPILQHRPRLVGDGPGSGAVYLMVARPRTREYSKWGSLPCWYQPERESNTPTGGKPLGLMRAIVRDYASIGAAAAVCDPCAGSGTTLLAAAIEGCRAIGAELDEATFKKARKRIARGHTPVLPHTQRRPREQLQLVAAEGT